MIPRFLYGTAWKEERTEPLVSMALRAGFRGIDTANQRKHYHEAGVGAALKEAFARGVVAREDLFLQTKFTHVRGQDHRLPYDPYASLATQVEQSFTSSLEHLGVEKLDAYLLHGPSASSGLADVDRKAWRAMETLQRAGRVRLIGISNVAIDQLEELHSFASVKPRVVQNRTFTRPAADRDVRVFCREHDIAYEGFSLLTAIPSVLAHPDVHAISTRVKRTPAEILFAWCLAEGMIVLTGTTSEEHMVEDLAAAQIVLVEDEIRAVARIFV
jgi:diketogulonate reductase-like aldo/keto reductase